jgi:hypothetical protein
LDGLGRVAHLVPAAGQNAVYVIRVGNASATLEAIQVIFALEIAACLSAGNRLDVILFLDARCCPSRIYAVRRGEVQLGGNSPSKDEEEDIPEE